MKHRLEVLALHRCGPGNGCAAELQPWERPGGEPAPARMLWYEIKCTSKRLIIGEIWWRRGESSYPAC